MNAKTERLSRKYALNIARLNIKNKKIINSKKFDNFYDDIESSDKTINNDKKLINNIKKLTIREFIYSNKAIPLSWKKKFNYKNDMIKIISNDNLVLSYLGSSSKNIISEKLPKIKYKSKSENNFSINNLNSARIKRMKKKFKFQKELDNDDIKVLLEDYKCSFPLKDKIEKLEKRYFSSLEGNSNIDKSKCDNENDFQSSYSKNSYNSINAPDNYRFNRKYIIKMNKKNFKQNIIGLESLKQNKNKSKILNDILYRNKRKNPDFNTNNKIIEKNIKGINYYGPHFSFCTSCKSKNLEFYNHMEPNQCLKLINHIKNFRKNNNHIVNKKIKKCYSSLVSNDISLFNNSKKKETLESDDYKI